jgi:hypothetical protein
MYLANIVRTVGNVKKYLPKWIVRLYIDPSVFNGLAKYLDLDSDNSEIIRNVFGEPLPKAYPYISKALECLFKAENVEMYTYFCDNMNTDFVRSYRFLPMIDPSVSAYAVREADGVVTVMDCNNLTTMVNNGMPMYIIPYINSIPCLNNGLSYQRWLIRYKDIEEYFNKHSNVFDLLAGTFSSTIKILPEHYYKCAGEVIEWLTHNKDINFAFDEILLLRTFRDLICIDSEKISDEEFYGNGKRLPEKLIEDTKERIAILIDGTIELEPVYKNYSYVYNKELTITLDPKKGPFNLPNLLCTPEQLQHLISWYDSILDKVEDMSVSRDSPTAFGYLFYQMIERLIGPSDNIINLIIKPDYDKNHLREEISTKQLANSSHITTWCSGFTFYKNEYYALCRGLGVNLMDLVRAKTKQILRDAKETRRMQQLFRQQ